MNRQQAIEKATHLRKGMDVFVKGANELEQFKTINAAKRFSRSLGLTAVALRGKETLPVIAA